ncbi:CidA/LrgA family protein [Xanthobacter dioxanivorans]|uniref:CidA/LrgA family protein n=1 Tax=Xanthobacter dioxanivorans TaxID=2528964 RepID=A0A974PUS4_9HYPH|nr:CidA/LrgA family protein [Xanthobacter dioxanivorans]QRG09769.1 CidA/LrgA family protein [Xanthobacter dioxanivorans]
MLRNMLRTTRSMLHRSIILQIAILAGFWAIGEAAVRLSGLPLPGGIVGMAVVLTLLTSGHIRPAAVRRGAGWLIAEMLLFFVPAVMAILDHGEMLGLLGLKVVAVILAGTVMVMGGTALAVDLCYRWRARAAGQGTRHAA